MRNRTSKVILILLGAGLLLCIGYLVYRSHTFDNSKKDYSVTDLLYNFNKKKTELYKLKKYFNEIVPKNRFVEIEFTNDTIVGRLGIRTLDASAGDPFEPMFLDWNLKINTTQMDSLVNPLGWTRETFIILKEKLDNANCIQIQSGEPTKIGFKRIALGMYSFNVFENPIPDSLVTYYNDSCTYIFVDSHLVLEYAGGEIGKQCFYGRKKNMGL